MWKSAKKQRLFYAKKKSRKHRVIDWQSFKKGNANDNKLSKGNTFGGI